MNKKALLTTLLLPSALFMANLFQLHSQEDETRNTYGVVVSETQQEAKKYNAYKTTWTKNRFKDTWYITFGSGAQILMAEDDDKASLTSRVTYAPTLTIGKYFSPIWGLRVQFTGGSLHGFNDGRDGTYRKWNNGSKNYLGEGYAPNVGATVGTDFQTWDPSWNRRGFTLNNVDPSKRIVHNAGGNGTYAWEPGLFGNDKELYMQHIKYVAANFNFMFDFLTLVGNYNPKRAFEITPYAGLSVAHVIPSEGQTAYNTFGANGGLNFKVRLSSKFDFNVEGGMTLYPDEFDGQLGGSRSIDIVTQATAGITYKIGKSTWEIAEPMNYEMIRDLNDKINSLQLELRDRKPCPECPPCPVISAPATGQDLEAKKQTITFLPDPVFFRLDKSVIDGSEWAKIDKAANYLSTYPDANVVITGYADKKTGNPAYNMRLSERRAKAVSKTLMDKYGVNPLRISINWEGDRVQPFQVNEWNRVVVFVIE